MSTRLLYQLLLLILITGCHKTELLRYEEGDNVYFLRGNGYLNYDTIYVNFAFLGKDTSVSTGFNVYLMGNLATRDRSFIMTTDTSNATAVENKNYRLAATDSCFIPANNTKKWIPLTILKTADLYEKSISFTLKLNANENFQTISAHSRSAVPNLIVPGTASANTLKIIIEDLLPEPVIWSNNYHLLGAYSRKKMELFVKTLSLRFDRFYSSSTYSTVELATPARRMQIYLNRQKSAGQMVRETDGTEMKMGTAVQ